MVVVKALRVFGFASWGGFCADTTFVIQTLHDVKGILQIFGEQVQESKIWVV